jgi:hypothetical protein
VKAHQSTARKLTATLAVITLVALGASGCASSASPTVSQSPSVTPTSTPTPTPTSLTPAQALAEFKAIAQASSAKADKDGLTQTTVNSKYGTYVLVLDRNYNKDYQAAVHNADGSYELLYEADSFAPAAALAAIKLGATVAYANGVWVLTEMIEGTPTNFDFTVVDGLISSESGSSVADTWTSTLSYAVTADGHKIIDEAAKKPTH